MALLILDGDRGDLHRPRRGHRRLRGDRGRRDRLRAAVVARLGFRRTAANRGGPPMLGHRRSGRSGPRWRSPPCSRPPYSRPPPPPRRARPQERADARVPRPGDHPDRDDLHGDNGRRPVVDLVRRRQELLRHLRRPGQRALLQAAREDLRRRAGRRRHHLHVRHDAEAAGRDAVPDRQLDPEGFTLTKHNRKAVITSEGFANRLINPWIRVYRLDGTYVRDVPVGRSSTRTRPARRESA